MRSIVEGHGRLAWSGGGAPRTRVPLHHPAGAPLSGGDQSAATAVVRCFHVSNCVPSMANSRVA
jgi:hypothetical protein